MSSLKTLSVSILSFFLFLSLSVFGVAFAINSTVLNPDFVTEEINSLNLAELSGEAIEIEPSAEMSEAYDYAISTLSDIEPLVKQKMNAAVHSVYDYLLGEKSQPELKTALGDTFFSPAFVGSLLDELELAKLLEENFPEPTTQADISQDFIDAIVRVAADIEPELKPKLAAASGPVFDYLLGEVDDIDLALTLRTEVLTSETVLSLIDKIAIYSLVTDALGGELTQVIPPGTDFLIDIIDDLMPELSAKITAQISSNIDPLLDYILGQSETLDMVISLEGVVETLEDSLREHLLNIPPETLTPFVRDIVSEQITEVIPSQLSPYTETAITDDWIDEQIENNHTPLLSYLLGESPDLNISIDLEPVLLAIGDAFKPDFLESPPPELAGLSSSLLEEEFDSFYEQLIQSIPTTITIDETMVGADLPGQIDQIFGDLASMMPTSFNIGEVVAAALPAGQVADALTEAEISLAGARQDIDRVVTEAEDSLVEARRYIDIFQTVYIALIFFMVALGLGIVVILRDVHRITRTLGIPLLIYGVIHYAGIWIARFLTSGQINIPNLSSVMEEWLYQSANNALRPLEIFSLGILIAGVALTVISFVYRRE